MTKNPRAFPKSLTPSTLCRTESTELNARTRLRMITGLIAEKSTIAISIGLGSTANDGSQPLIKGSVSFFAWRKLPTQTGIAAGR